jgi:hypothetical protein
VLQGVYEGVTRVLRGCYEGVTRVLPGDVVVLLASLGACSPVETATMQAQGVA